MTNLDLQFFGGRGSNGGKGSKQQSPKSSTGEDFISLSAKVDAAKFDKVYEDGDEIYRQITVDGVRGQVEEEKHFRGRKYKYAGGTYGDFERRNEHYFNSLKAAEDYARLRVLYALADKYRV